MISTQSASARQYAPTTTVSVDGERCVTCGAPAGTPYCASCGERRAADRPRSLAALSEELWDAFSPVDGRIGRTLWTLVRRPGELTAAYMRGVRLPYVPPLRLFLLVNVLFFLHASLVHNHMFDTPLRTHLEQTEHGPVAKRMVQRRLGDIAADWRREHGRRATPTEVDSIAAAYARRFDANSTTQARSLVIAMVPLFALLVTAVTWRRGRNALQDVVFATHAMAVLLLLVVFAAYTIGIPMQVSFALARLRPSDHAQDLMISSAMALLFAVWLRAALHRVYGDGRVAASAKAFLLAFGFAAVLFAYRALLFFTVFWTT